MVILRWTNIWSKLKNSHINVYTFSQSKLHLYIFEICELCSILEFLTQNSNNFDYLNLT